MALTQSACLRTARNHIIFDVSRAFTPTRESSVALQVAQKGWATLLIPSPCGELNNDLPNYGIGSGRTFSHCSPGVSADAQLSGLWPECISMQCQQSWQVHYLCNKSLKKVLARCASPGRCGYEVCGRMGWCSLSSLMRLCSPNLTANRIFTL